MSLTIWGRANSLNVHKVLWTAAELDLKFEHIPAGGQYGGLDTPEFLTINPNGRVPTLQDGKTIIWESNTIIRYLAEVYGKDSLWIADPAQRFSAEKWIDWTTTTVLPVFGIIFFNLVRATPEQQDLQAVKDNIPKLENILDVAEITLAQQPYLSGEQFGVADIPLALYLNHWFKFEIERTKQHPHLEQWIERIRQRPHFEKVASIL
ncbi:MAG: glutathione S-transferase family protein [Acinetobacter sp.]